MRLSDEEFAHLTPGLFEALLDRKMAADKAEYARAGIIAAAVINYSMGAPETPVSPMDFVPGERKSSAGHDLSSMTPAEQAKAVKSMFTKKKFKRRS